MAKQPPPRSLLSEDEVAEMMAVSKRTIQAWRYLGKGPKFVKIESSVRYRPGDVDAWLKSNLRSSTKGR